METITLKRVISSNKATLGILSNDKGLELARTLELPNFDNKPNISCIPFGEYIVEQDNAGKHRYFKILNVSNRSNIEIHVGNYTTDIDGCIVCAQSWVFSRNEKTNQVEQALNPTSRITMNKLKEILPPKFKLKIIS